jgi:phosphoglucosamine mutase
VVIGKDTLLSGYMIEQAICAGITSLGVDVMLTGPLPTPGVAFITASMRADAGIVVSASHNPYQDNGIKVFGHDGFKLPDAVEEELERLILDPSLVERYVPTGADIGKASRIDDAKGRCIVHLKSTFPHALTLEGLRVVVDCAHGAAYAVAPPVFRELGATVLEMGTEPDGTVDGSDFIAFINSFSIGDATIDPLADVAGAGDDGLEPDGTIDGSDFIAFINSFAIGDASVDPIADVAGGGIPNLPAGGPDGTIDGTDFIAFINAFGAGC